MRRSTATTSSSATGLLAAAADVAQSFTRTSLWITLGWYDFTLRYRRTSVGPLWEIVVMGVWVVGLGVLFGRLLGHSRESFLAYLAAGVTLVLHGQHIDHRRQRVRLPLPFDPLR